MYGFLNDYIILLNRIQWVIAAGIMRNLMNIFNENISIYIYERMAQLITYITYIFNAQFSIVHDNPIGMIKNNFFVILIGSLILHVIIIYLYLLEHNCISI